MMNLKIFEKIKELAPLRSVILTTAIITTIVIVSAICGEKIISSDKFCTSCHSMSYPAEELKSSKHSGSLGITPKCADCHLPEGIILRNKVHMVSGMIDTWSTLVNDFGSVEKFDEHRVRLAEKARQDLHDWNSQPCKSCHQSPNPAVHDMMAQMKNVGTIQELNCIECHQNIAHKEVPKTTF